MKYILASMLALGLSGAPLLADHHECTCSKECQEACAKGEGAKTCTCKACDCKKKGKACTHKKCVHHEHEGAAPSK